MWAHSCWGWKKRGETERISGVLAGMIIGWSVTLMQCIEIQEDQSSGLWLMATISDSFPAVLLCSVCGDVGKVCVNMNQNGTQM